MASQRTNHNRPSSTTSSEKTAPVNHNENSSRVVGREKRDVSEKEAVPNRGHDETTPDFSHIDEKKVLRKMDIRLLPMLALLYLLSFLDRGNIGNARIEGMNETLNLTGPQYNWCLTVFFFTYCAFEVPSNLM